MRPTDALEPTNTWDVIAMLPGVRIGKFHMSLAQMRRAEREALDVRRVA